MPYFMLAGVAIIATGASSMSVGSSLTEKLIALVALSAMEIVLGIDNIVFISVITGRLPAEQRNSARKIGLGLALLMRVMLLMTLSTIMHMTQPLLRLDAWMPDIETRAWLAEEAQKEINEVSWRDIILLAGGLFLIFKSVKEVHAQIEGHHEGANGAAGGPSFLSVLIQIALLDIIFSLDSVITAVGMADDIYVMIASVILAIIIMMVFANQVANFVEHNPTIKMLALSFLILIGVMLVADGLGTHISKGYVYFAMAFSLLVEMLNIRARKKSKRGPSPAIE